MSDPEDGDDRPDIVVRLREVAENDWGEYVNALCSDAADNIEILRALLVPLLMEKCFDELRDELPSFEQVKRKYDA